MKIRTNVRAGGPAVNHNEVLVHTSRKTRGMKVRTNVKAGLAGTNHNETMLDNSIGM